MFKPVYIHEASAVSGLGDTFTEYAEKMQRGESAIQPLSELNSDFTGFQGAWIEDRKRLLSRKWAPASMLAIEAVRKAIEISDIPLDELKESAIIVGTSRGNAWLGDWPDRRSFKLMRASNSMHGEVASAVSIEFGITGPWQVISSGCAASLDAIGIASMMLQTGVVKHAIAVGVELPLVPTVLKHYQETGVLATNSINDPYHSETSGFFAGEGGSALILSLEKKESAPSIAGYWCNSDAHSPVGMPTDGKGLQKCLQQAVSALPDPILHVCPHASGTPLHAQAEQHALQEVLKEPSISLHPLKPFIGHTVGASGSLETAILAMFLRKGTLPPNLPDMTQTHARFHLPQSLEKAQGTILKIAVGMGGHNSILALNAN